MKKIKIVKDDCVGTPAKPGALQRIYSALNVSKDVKLSDVMKLAAIRIKQNHPLLKASDLMILSQGLTKRKLY